MDVPHYLSISSLESLSLGNPLFQHVSPSTCIHLKHLRCLCIRIPDQHNTDFINRLVPQLDALKDLHLCSSYGVHCLDLKSVTVRKLTLDLDTNGLRISAPSLEFFELKSGINMPLTKGGWEMSMLRKAVIQLKLVSENDVEAISEILNDIASMQKLHIDIMESQNCYKKKRQWRQPTGRRSNPLQSV